MTIQEFALNMWPMWLFGIFIICVVKNSVHKDLLQINYNGIKIFLFLLAILTLYRFLVIDFFSTKEYIYSIRSSVYFLPWQGSLFVFWEDACHTLPLAIFSRIFNKGFFYKMLYFIFILIVMLSFGLGHLYEGIISAICLCFYIPITLKLGKKYGFGTIMICHILYDLTTLLTLRLFVNL